MPWCFVTSEQNKKRDGVDLKTKEFVSHRTILCMSLSGETPPTYPYISPVLNGTSSTSVPTHRPTSFSVHTDPPLSTRG